MEPVILTGVVVAAVLAAPTWVAHSLRRRNEELISRVGPPERDPPPVGSQAPDFKLRDLDGVRVTLAQLLASDRAVMLLFVAPDCGICTTLMPDVARWQTEYAAVLDVVLISTGDVETNRAKTAPHGIERVLLQRDFEVATAYAVSGTPSAYIIQPSGTIGSPRAGGALSIRALLDEFVALLAESLGVRTIGETEVEHLARTEAAPLQIGIPVPDRELTNIHGDSLCLTAFRGRDVVILYWDVKCRYCRELLPDISMWESSHDSGKPELLVVLPSGPDNHHRLNFRPPVVVDNGLPELLHLDRTPSAVLIDQYGRIASQPAIGAMPVLELLRPKRQQTPSICMEANGLSS